MDKLSSYQRFLILGISVGAKTFLDFEDPDTIFYIRSVFATSLIGVSMTLLVILYKIKFTKDFHETKVSVKDSQMQIFEGQPGANDEVKYQVTVAQYDMVKFYSILWKLFISYAITSFLHAYYEFVIPLLIMAYTQPKVLSQEKLFHVHMMEPLDECHMNFVGKDPRIPMYRRPYGRPWPVQIPWMTRKLQGYVADMDPAQQPTKAEKKGKAGKKNKRRK